MKSERGPVFRTDWDMVRAIDDATRPTSMDATAQARFAARVGEKADSARRRSRVQRWTLAGAFGAALVALVLVSAPGAPGDEPVPRLARNTPPIWEEEDDVLYASDWLRRDGLWESDEFSSERFAVADALLHP